MASFRKINYRLRPAKNIERKMMVDIIRRIPHIRSLDDYRYIGFGSPYFGDVTLFHKRLGINDIVSIEKEKGFKRRFQFNKPYEFVDLRFGKSTEVLPELDWDKPIILWLDYDDPLETYMLSDIREFMTSAQVGSLLFVTVNAHPANRKKLREQDKTMLDVLKENLDRKYIPNEVTWEDLRGWGYGDIARRIIMNQINDDSLPIRNAGVPDEEKVEFRQLVNFRYKDGAKMRTVGGILWSSAIDEDFLDASFDNLEFYRDGEESYKIDTPKLTFKEMRALDQFMPKKIEDVDLQLFDSEIEKYSKVYRYFPRFIESEM